MGRLRPRAPLPLPLPARRRPGGRARLWRRLHAGLLRLQLRAEAAVPRPARRQRPRARTRARGASSTRRCGRSPRPARARASRSPRSAARSSGRRRDRDRAAGRFMSRGLMARIVFDLDGTLVAFAARRMAAAGNALLAELGRPALAPRDLARLRRRTASSVLVERLLRAHRRRARVASVGAACSPAFARSTTADPVTGTAAYARRARRRWRARRRRAWPRRLHPEAGRAGAARCSTALGLMPPVTGADRRRQPRRAEARPADAAPCRRPASARGR